VLSPTKDNSYWLSADSDCVAPAGLWGQVRSSGPTAYAVGHILTRGGDVGWSADSQLPTSDCTLDFPSLLAFNANRKAMNSALRFFFQSATGPASLFLIRLPVGLIFFTQGILKFTDPKMGVERFTRIGFSHPGFTAHFVGTFEIICGALVLLGLWTRVAALPLLIVISTAIATTKLPELARPTQGFWFMVSDARTDFAMFCSLVFLILTGAGAWSLDARQKIPSDAEAR